jgi:hypothetical protein
MANKEPYSGYFIEVFLPFALIVFVLFGLPLIAERFGWVS